MCYTSTTPEEEPLRPGSSERIHRCIPTGKNGIGEEGIHLEGDSP
jgi:hypothetical protein